MGGGLLAAAHLLTRPPQLLALLLVGEAHAIVAVGLAALAGGAVHLVEVGGTMGRLARAELGEVALLGLLAAQRARGQQLSRGEGKTSLFCLPSPLLAKGLGASLWRSRISHRYHFT